MTNQYDILEDAVRDMLARAIWSHKVQEKQSDIYLRRYNWLMITSIICSAITTGGILTIIFKENIWFKDCVWLKLLSAVIPSITLVISTYLKNYDLTNLIKIHKEAANKLLIVRNEITCLITSIKLKSKSVIELEIEYKSLMSNANEIYKDAPQTTDKALNKAKKALKISKDNSFTDEEIDSYLPYNLRKGK